jgi:hypothetical protein
MEVTNKHKSVPPLWELLSDLWIWLDGSDLIELSPSEADEKNVIDRIPWWEDMAEQSWTKNGWVFIV